MQWCSSQDVCVPHVLHADIYRWDNGELIPGTEGISPGPGVVLPLWNRDTHNLRFADFAGGLDLHNARFGLSWLDNATFENSRLVGAVLNNSVLTDANLSGANLTGASMHHSTLTHADLTVANLTNADLSSSTLTNAILTRANPTDANLATLGSRMPT